MTIKNINTQSPDIIFHIFFYLPPSELNESVSRISKFFKTISNDPVVWKKIAVNLNVKIRGKKPKQELYNQIKKINNIFSTSIHYFKNTFIFLAPGLEQTFPLDTFVRGENRFDTYKKIQEWCKNNIQTIITPKNEKITRSPFLILIKFFNEEWDCPESHFPIPPNIPPPPTTIYHPWISEFFLSIHPNVLPNISYAYQKYA